MKRVAHTLGFVIGLVLGLSLTALTFRLLPDFGLVDVYANWNLAVIIATYGVVTAVCVMMSVAFAEPMGRLVRKGAHRLAGLFNDIPTSVLIFGVLGLIIGLVLALLFSQLYRYLPWVWLQWVLTAVTYAVFGYLGVAISTQRQNEITRTFIPKRTEKFEKIERKEKYQNAKILDTSVVIDGRIYDVVRAGFLEGTLIISDLVLHELRHIADDREQSKRTRGRRGLDILKLLQDEFKSNVVVVDTSGKYQDIQDVDEKLVKLTKDLKGKIVTNDYNLNKMAQVQKVPVLNINELAQSIKLSVMSGEVLRVNIIKKGTEKDQGVAYLDDGTMIVVDHGAGKVGEELEVEVTSIIQTVSGRMIFAAAKETLGLQQAT